MLEHVVAARNMREWKDQVCTEIHKERQDDQRRKAKSQAITKRVITPTNYQEAHRTRLY